MKDAGFKVTKSDKLPKVENEKFKKPVVINVEFANGEGVNVLAQKRIMFTKKGYSMIVLGSDKKEFQRLVKWAKQIKPIK